MTFSEFYNWFAEEYGKIYVERYMKNIANFSDVPVGFKNIHRVPEQEDKLFNIKCLRGHYGKE